jgi:hypothetical protein
MRALAAEYRAGVRRRHFLMPAILLVHILALAWLALAPSNLVVAPAFATSISVFNVPSADPVPPAQQQPEQPRTPLPAPMVDLQIETPLEASPPIFSAAAAEQAGFGTSCELADLLGRAFADNPILRAQLARIGPEARSVANAIMFWDGQWVEIEKRAPQDAVSLLRQAIVDGIKAAPPECLGQDVAGPRFIPVKDSEGTIILVLGSATWRWDQLLTQDPPASGPSQPIPSDDAQPRAAGIGQ